MHRPLIALAVALLGAPVLAHHTGRVVKATVYDPWYAGRTTYCGKRYDHWGLSAAHPWLECGSRVIVAHKGRVLSLPVTDRCDCAIDLSAGAAYRLGIPVDGVGKVSLSY